MVGQRFQYLHYVLREELNKPLPRSLAECAGWRRVPTSEAVYHQNGRGAAEIKLVAPDGREVVFDGDTLRPIDLHAIGGSYNYCPPLPFPGWRLRDWPEYLAAALMHFALDVVPYWAEKHSKSHYRLQNAPSALLTNTMNSEIQKIRERTEKQLETTSKQIAALQKTADELTEVLDALPATSKPAAAAAAAPVSTPKKHK